ncbi:AmmeMemoRadiSam system protein A [Abyssisolibacter fermentans]|uniref:AmmeMemoRadiSam system protein A n=1 Tax=Abyssisolibacter fermentans TaxID=1766203 RepID=UPI00082E5B11|nr:AmmeMemoRadiSam system protein A [Abyssisolibacter fermentans]
MGKIKASYICPHPPIIVSEIGGKQSKLAKKTIEGCQNIAKDISKRKPDTIILITPHGTMFRDAIAIGGTDLLKGNFKNFGFQNIHLSKKNDLELTKKIIKSSEKNGISCVFLNENNCELYNIDCELDHGALVPLYFVDKEYKDYDLVHITYGLLSNKELYEFGKCIQETVNENEKDVVIIASGDLSHKLSNDGPYEYNPLGQKFDNLMTQYIKYDDRKAIMNIEKNLRESAAECGFLSIVIMLGALDGYSSENTVLSYEGPFGVGYMTAILDYKDKEENKKLLECLINDKKKKIEYIRKNEDEHVALARKSLESYIMTGKVIEDKSNVLPEDMLTKRAGTFVSIKKDGDLRGCIGTIIATQKNIYKEIIDNAIKAGTEDPRFSPVRVDELDSLVYSVDVLGESEKISSLDELDVKRYGIIVVKGSKRGLLLPNLDGVNTVNEQINIALRKADILSDEKYDIYKFEVIRHK